jgi:hypothetical protein
MSNDDELTADEIADVRESWREIKRRNQAKMSKLKGKELKENIARIIREAVGDVENDWAAVTFIVTVMFSLMTALLFVVVHQ